MKPSDLIDIINNSNIKFLPFEIDKKEKWEMSTYYYLYKKDKLQIRKIKYGENIKQGNFINHASKYFLDKIFGENKIDEKKTIKLIFEIKF